MHEKSHIVKSADGVSIQYEVQGNGTPALVFVHGWCCSRRFWDQQVDFFARRYMVVTLDLAGHGASGRDRAKWTMEAFGGDVAAVVEQLVPQQVVSDRNSLPMSRLQGGAWHLALRRINTP